MEKMPLNGNKETIKGSMMYSESLVNNRNGGSVRGMLYSKYQFFPVLSFSPSPFSRGI